MSKQTPKDKRAKRRAKRQKADEKSAREDRKRTTRIASAKNGELWGDWVQSQFTDEQAAKIDYMNQQLPDELWLNKIFQVMVVHDAVWEGNEGWPKMSWISVSRMDGSDKISWQDLQTIKNDIMTSDCEGMEIFPSERRLVDTSNQRNLFVFRSFSDRFPVGYDERQVTADKTKTLLPGFKPTTAPAPEEPEEIEETPGKKFDLDLDLEGTADADE